MTTYYKATRLDGTDFHSGTIDYAAALVSGEVIRHPSLPSRKVRDVPATYLSVSVDPADCTGFSWPCRLFRVAPVGRIMARLDASPNKRAVSGLRVIEELPAHLALGPNGEAVATFIKRMGTLTLEQARHLDASSDASWVVLRDASSAALRDASWAVLRDASWVVLRDASWAVSRAALRAAFWAASSAILVRYRITPEQYAIFTQPFVDAGLGEWVGRAEDAG